MIMGGDVQKTEELVRKNEKEKARKQWMKERIGWTDSVIEDDQICCVTK